MNSEDSWKKHPKSQSQPIPFYDIHKFVCQFQIESCTVIVHCMGNLWKKFNTLSLFVVAVAVAAAAAIAECICRNGSLII